MLVVVWLFVGDEGGLCGDLIGECFVKCDGPVCWEPSGELKGLCTAWYERELLGDVVFLLWLCIGDSDIVDVPACALSGKGAGGGSAVEAEENRGVCIGGEVEACGLPLVVGASGVAGFEVDAVVLVDACIGVASLGADEGPGLAVVGGEFDVASFSCGEKIIPVIKSELE